MKPKSESNRTDRHVEKINASKIELIKNSRVVDPCRLIDKKAIENRIKLTATSGLMAAAPVIGYFRTAMSKLHPANSKKEIITTNKT